MRIGELSRKTGASARSLRYYEHCGLIEAERSASGQRHYDESAVERVDLVRQLLTAGLSTTAIADVLPCMTEPESQTTKLTQRLIVERDRIDEEIAQRATTRAALDEIIAAAPAQDR